ncbi:hypothetical protein pb186bvf_012500 [Paramecium bursaria]
MYKFIQRGTFQQLINFSRNSYFLKYLDYLKPAALSAQDPISLSTCTIFLFYLI